MSGLMWKIKRGVVPLFLLFFLFLLSGKVNAKQTNSDSLFVPAYSYEYIPDVTYDTLEKRIARIESRIPLHFNTKVKAFIDYFTVRDREYTRKVIGRSHYYFPIFEKIIQEHNLPDELKYLAIVESGLAANARSRAAAVGLWQFIYTTGRIYNLHADWYIDERMDPYKSTEAACRLLSSLYNQFGDWELALAAYNCGPGNVRKAIRRSGYKHSFWEIYRYLPRETRSYVPQFVSIIYVFKHLEEHNFYLEPEEKLYPLPFDTIQVKHFLNLQSLAKQLNVCDEELQLLNPSIKQGALPDLKKHYTVRIPSYQFEYFTENRSAIMDSAAKEGKKQIEYLARNSAGSTYGREKITYRVRSGDVLGKIAGKYHVRVSDLKRWNNLHGNMIRVGQRLNIWLKPHFASNYKSSPKNNTPARPKTSVVNGKKYHIVQEGESLWSIARIYENLTIDKLKKMNQLTTNKIKPGQKLLVG
jgi:membrane-bound lytic murein transglycosylase D